MRSTTHITDKQFRHYATQTLSATDWDVMEHHLQECEACRQRLATEVDFAGLYHHLASHYPIDLAEHPEFERLAHYAEGQSEEEEQEIIRQHLAVCEMCRTEVRDLQQMTEAISPTTVSVTTRADQPAFTTKKVLPYALAASIVLLGIVLTSHFSRSSSIPTEVATTIKDQKIEFTNPTVHALVAAGDTESAPQSQTLTILSPANLAVRESSPTFSWSDTASTHIYRLSVIANGRIIASESGIKATHWQPKEALPQGMLLNWRLETVGSNAQKQEAPFIILTPTENTKLAQAERDYATNPLVLGTIYAQAGLFEEAEHSLATAVKSDPQSSAAKTLLGQVQALHPSSPAISP